MTCTIPRIGRETLMDRIAARALAERIPLTASLEIIATCNFRCQHCYIAPCAEREDVMSVADATRILRQLRDAGTYTVLLTGGEVFTHRHFADIYLETKRLGLVPLLNTNGYLIGRKWADFLADWPPDVVSISVYGLSDERYRQVTGIPRAFSRVVRAIDLLLERGIELDLKCPAMTLTADELPAMQEFARARGVKFRYDPAITPQEKGDVAPLQLQLAPKAVVALDERLDPEFEEFTRSFERIVAIPVDGSAYKCGAGRMGLHVTVRGDVTTCTASRRPVGNLLRQSFDEVWAVLGGKVQAKFQDGHPCATCRFRGICLGCPATVEEITGLPTGYVQQFCRITHLRAHRAGFHPTGVPRTVVEGIPAHVRTPAAAASRALPVVA
jgi:radical SAM protein with 4Fe4S-binding SPASM domain